jgi:hypothetical protein
MRRDRVLKSFLFYALVTAHIVKQDAFGNGSPPHPAFEDQVSLCQLGWQLHMTVKDRSEIRFRAASECALRNLA